MVNGEIEETCVGVGGICEKDTANTARSRCVSGDHENKTAAARSGKERNLCI